MPARLMPSGNGPQKGPQKGSRGGYVVHMLHTGITGIAPFRHPVTPDHPGRSGIPGWCVL